MCFVARFTVGQSEVRILLLRNTTQLVVADAKCYRWKVQTTSPEPLPSSRKFMLVESNPLYSMMLWIASMYAVQCLYNAVIFLHNSHNRRPISRPWGRGMGCLVWIQSPIYVLLLWLQYCVWYLDMLYRVITVPHCIYPSKIEFDMLSVRRLSQSHAVNLAVWFKSETDADCYLI